MGKASEKVARSAALTLPARVDVLAYWAVLMHFLTEESLAAPDKGLPSLLTALASQADCMSFSHFAMKEDLAAPDKGLPSLLTALDSHGEACAEFASKRNADAAAIRYFFIQSSP